MISSGEQDRFELVLGELRSRAEGNVGNWLAKVFNPIALAFGIKSCASCEVRQVILNLTGKIGVAKTVELLSLSFKEDPQYVADRIRKALYE
jgi:hypothetical protein